MLNKVSQVGNRKMQSLLVMFAVIAMLAVTASSVNVGAQCSGQGAWVAGPNVPPPAMVRSVGVYFPTNGKFYAMGGRSADTAGSDFTNPFEYDPTTNAWTTKAAVYPDNEVNNMACGVLTLSGTPQIICVGGSAAGATTSSPRVFAYNPVTDTITTLGSDPWTGNASGDILPGGFAVVNNKLYTIGGFQINVGMVADVWQFDPAAAAGSRWASRAALPVQRGYVPAAEIGGIIYTAGGSAWNGTTLIDSVESFKYDPVANTWTAIASIPRATGETRGLHIGNDFAVLGGGRVAPNPSNQVDVYNIASNTWSTGPAFTTARRNFPAGTDGSRVWLAGGYAPTTGVNTMEIFCPAGAATPTPTPVVPTPTPTPTPVVPTPTPTPVVPTPTPTPVVATPTPTPVVATPTPTPVVATPTPTPVVATPTPTPVVTTPTPSPQASPSCAPSAWTSGPAQPPARALFQGATGSDGKFYAVGGQNTSGSAVNAEVGRYNPATNAWESVASLPVGTGQDSVAAGTNNKIYVAGGFVLPAAVVSTLRIYDIATNTWSTGASMPAAKEAAAAAVLNGKLYVMGGDDGANGVNTNYIYDIAGNSWSTGAPLPDARTNTAATAVGNFIYVFGGGTISGTTTTAVDNLLRYDPATNTWTDLGSANTGGLGNWGGVSPFGANQLLLTAGATGTFVPANVSRIFNITTGTFSAGPTMLINRAGHAQGTLPDGRVIVADGFDTNTTTTATVELLGTGCPSPSPTPSPAVPTPTPTRTPTPVASPSPSASPILRFCNSDGPIDMTLNQPAALYPSVINVAGAPPIAGGVIVTLTGLWHQFPDNIDILLVGPNGGKFVLMADAGGPIAVPQNAPVTLILRDFQPNVLPNNGPLVSGTFMPTNWETPVLSFAAPAPPAPYVEPGNQAFPPIGRTLFGTFGLLNPNGAWSLYVRDDGGNPVDPDVLIGSIAGWCIEFLPPTAAGVSLSGRVTTAGGNGIRNARVTISGNSLPEARVVTTGSFGYYSIDGLTAGETYVVTVNSQRYTFQMPSRVVTLEDNLTDFDWIAEPNEAR